MKNEIEELKLTINDLNTEIKSKDIKSKNEITQLKQMLENLKILHEQMKDQYDLLMLKLNTINQENFSLKRELYFYQNTVNNNMNSNNTNYSSNNNNNNNYNSNNNMPNRYNENNKYENEYQEPNENIKSFKSKNSYNNIQIDIENNNNNQFNYKKLNKDRLENNYNYKLNNGINNQNEEIVPTITNSHRKFIGNINQNDSSGVSALLKNSTNVRENQSNKREKTPIITTLRNNKFQNFDNYEQKPKNLRNIQNLKRENKSIYLNEESIEQQDYFNKNINENNNYFIETNYNISNNSNNANLRYNNINKRRKIARNKSIDYPNNENTNSNIRENNYVSGESNVNNRNLKRNNQLICFPSESDLKKEKKINEIGTILIKLQKQRDIYLQQYDKLPEHPKKQKDLNEKRELKKLIDDLNMNINEYKKQERNIKKNYFEFI